MWVGASGFMILAQVGGLAALLSSARLFNLRDLFRQY